MAFDMTSPSTSKAPILISSSERFETNVLSCVSPVWPRNVNEEAGGRDLDGEEGSSGVRGEKLDAAAIAEPDGLLDPAGVVVAVGGPSCP